MLRWLKRLLSFSSAVSSARPQASAKPAMAPELGGGRGAGEGASEGAGEGVGVIKGVDVADIANLADAARDDWLEPALIISEAELALEHISEAAGSLARRIVDDVIAERLELPVMPELGLAVRRKTMDPNSSASDITRIVQADMMITTKLIQVANSAVYAGYEPVRSLNEAIARMGMRAVRNIVTGLTVKHLFATRQPRLRRRMRDLWEHSTRVAANCAVLARYRSDFDPEQALLAGLVHDVGELAIINYANGLDAADFTDDELASAIDHLKARLGALLLRSWRLDEEFVFAALNADKLDRAPDSVVRMVDLIQVAQLHALAGRPGFAMPEMQTVPAVRKLGLDIDGAENTIGLLREARRDVEQVRAALAT